MQYDTLILKKIQKHEKCLMKKNVQKQHVKCLHFDYGKKLCLTDTFFHNLVNQTQTELRILLDKSQSHQHLMNFTILCFFLNI